VLLRTPTGSCGITLHQCQPYIMMYVKGLQFCNVVVSKLLHCRNCCQHLLHCSSYMLLLPCKAPAAFPRASRTWMGSAVLLFLCFTKGCGLATAWQRLSCHLCVHIIHRCMHFLLDDQMVALRPAHARYTCLASMHVQRKLGCCSRQRHALKASLHSARAATRPVPLLYACCQSSFRSVDV
jgi:hypothetical protein